MADDKKAQLAATANALLPALGKVDDRVMQRVEQEIEEVISEVLHPYLMETIPPLMRKLNHQGVFDKIVREFLNEYLKKILAEYVETAREDLTNKIDRKFRETVNVEYESKVEQAAKKMLEDALAKVKREFVK